MMAAARSPTLAPLLFDACRCGPGGRMRCMACLRWFRHWRMVMQRRRAWGAVR